MPTLLENFAAATFTHRMRAGITPEVLATKAGVSATTINNIENAHANPTLSTMEAVAAALNLSLPHMLLQTQSAEKAPEPKQTFFEWIVRKFFF